MIALRLPLPRRLKYPIVMIERLLFQSCEHIPLVDGRRIVHT